MSKTFLSGLSAFKLGEAVERWRIISKRDPSEWPSLPRAILLATLAAMGLGLVATLDWSSQQDELTQLISKEGELRQQWLFKKRQSGNLGEYKKQLQEIELQLGAMIRQLPDRAEMDSLLSEINAAGTGRGLEFDLFKPKDEELKEFYAELPVSVSVKGDFRSLAGFADQVARMSRIVALKDIAIVAEKPGALRMDATATTYRYLDDNELAQQRKLREAASKTKGNKK